MLAKDLHDLGDRRLLLADRHIDADDVLTFLIDDRIDRHRGLAGLAVADDQFALAATDRNHRVDRLESGLERFFHRLTFDHVRRAILR